MMKNITKVALLASLGFAGQLLATEFRAPIATTNGPLYYSFDKLHKKKSNFTMWSVGEARESSEAFIKHGTDTHPLSQLFFGKDKFTIGESFQDGEATKWGLTENYNPYLDLTKLAPRVSYSERGVIWGASWDYPVWKNCGRVGIRASVPFKYVRLERDDQAEDAELGIQEHVIKGDSRNYKNTTIENELTSDVSAGVYNVSSYRLSLLKSLLYKDGNGYVVSAFRSLPGDNPHGTSVVSGQYKIPVYDSSEAAKFYSNTTSTKIPFVVIKAQHAGKAPYYQGGALLANAAGTTIIDNGVETGDSQVIYPDVVNASATPSRTLAANERLLELPLNGNVTDNTRAYAFVNGANNADNDYYNKIPKTTMDELWLTTINKADGDVVATSKGAVDFIDNLLLRYHFEVTDWLQDRGFQMQSNEDTSFGDITADIFYEHTFNDDWRAELCLGVKFPTGNGGSDYGDMMHNAYRVQMGNGSHWEIKLGAWGAWQAVDWMNIKLDVEANFALEDTEQRCAAYKNATIKNFGPRADAEVDWFYFVGNLDFNFTHPKTKKIKGMLGYQFYYKTEDHIDFKNSKDSTWLGDRWNKADGTMAPINPKVKEDAGTQWSAFTMDLDGHVARMNTEAFAHRLRMEGAYSLSKYLTVAVGGLYTFAGQNMPAETDIHAGCNLRF